jgi:hypothetical protein
MALPVPESVTALVSECRSQGRLSQPGVTWPRQRWIEAFPAFEGTFASLPDLLDRDCVREACLRATDDPPAATAAFLAVMAWGFGSVGYGRFRTTAILTGTPDASVKLQSVAHTLVQEGPDGAYRRLARPADCQLRDLGPAFGTKFLYFCQPPGQAVTALILDQFVATWLARRTPLAVNPVPWSPSTYRRYLTHLHAWAGSMGCRPDELEYWMFRAIASERGSQWA